MEHKTTITPAQVNALCEALDRCPVYQEECLTLMNLIHGASVTVTRPIAPLTRAEELEEIERRR